MTRAAALLLLAVALAGCGDDGSEALYAREAALPAACRAGTMTLEQARNLAGPTLVVGVPVEIDEVDAEKHRTTCQHVSEPIRIHFVRGHITRLAFAHEMAHAAICGTYRRNTAPVGQPSNEKSVREHGDEFVAAYKIMLRNVVSQECADAL